VGRFSAPFSDRPWIPPRLLNYVYRAFLGGKPAGGWCWLPTPSTAEVKERAELYLYFPSWFLWPVLGELYLYLYLYLHLNPQYHLLFISGDRTWSAVRIWAVIQGVLFIVWPSATGLSHRKPASAETWHDSRRAQRNDTKKWHTVYRCINYLCFPANNVVPLLIADQSLIMDSITACLSATEPNPSIGTVSTPYLPVQRAQTSNNFCGIRVVRYSGKVTTQSGAWEQIWA